MEEKQIQEAVAYLHALMGEADSGHGAEHALRVLHNAETLAKGQAVDPTVVRLAALLHDADDHKLFHTQNNANARAFLATQEVSPAQVEAICTAINSVSFSQNRGKRPATLEGQLVQDADRLDAIGAVGVARAFAYGGSQNRSLSDTVQHFYDKLLLLIEELNTPAAKALARPRQAFLLAFLAELEQEAPGVMPQK